MIGNIIAIIMGVIGIVVTLIVVIFSIDRCPYCNGKLIDDDYDGNIGKVVWTCKKCGSKWVLY